ncbi:MAG: hypothetical protein ACHQRK_09785 [Gemmatimonadales bacterium]|jgi:hypothetical protein
MERSEHPTLSGTATPPRAEKPRPAETADAKAETVAAACAAILAERGAIVALGFLNARTRFRFTGLYTPEPPLLRNLLLYDRENPTVNVSGAAAPLDETFCAIVCAKGEPFGTPDSHADSRLVPNAGRDVVMSYCGVPVRSASGSVRGTLCHFDFRPRLLEPAESAVLVEAAAVFRECFA